MFQKFSLVSLVFFFAVGCSGFGGKLPGPSEPKPPAQTPPPAPVVKPPASGEAISLVDLEKIAEAHPKCSKYAWKDRGAAKISYFKGFVLTFGRQLCRPSSVVASKPSMEKRVSSADGKSYYVDVLSHYEFDVSKFKNQPFKEAGLENEGGINTTRHVYTLIAGLGMRESSGQPFVGRDMSMDFSSADSAESGLMQSSYGARKRHAELEKLYEYFKSNPKGCFKETYYVGYKPDAANLKNWGDPNSEGYKFQKFQKDCPGFAVEYAAILSRVNGGGKGEYGPFRNKKAEVLPACDAMLQAVQSKIESNTKYCNLLE